MVQRLSPSTGIYAVLIILLAALGAANVFLPQGSFTATLPEQQLPASRPVMALVTAGILLIFYGGLGLIGLRLSQKLGFAAIWDPEISNRQRFLIPACIGMGTGIFLLSQMRFYNDGIRLGRFHTLHSQPR